MVKKIFKKKRQYRKRQRVSKTYLTRSVMSGKGPYPQSLIVNLPYCEEFSLGSNVSAGIKLYDFRANSIYDPDYTGTGKLAYGYNIYKDLYNKYCVISSTIHVQVIGGDANGIIGNTTNYASMRVFLSENATNNLSTYNEFFGSPLGSKRIATIGQGDTNGMRKWGWSTHSYNIKKYTKDEKDEAYCGEMGNNPSKNILYSVGICPANTANVTGVSLYKIMIRYKVLFYDPKDYDQNA